MLKTTIVTQIWLIFRSLVHASGVVIKLNNLKECLNLGIIMQSKNIWDPESVRRYQLCLDARFVKEY